MTQALRILQVEDNPADAEMIRYELQQGGFDVYMECVQSEETLFDALTRFTPDVVLSDYSLPRLTGLRVLDIVRGHLPQVPLIFISGTIGEERAVHLLRSGATDFVVKTNLSRLVPVLQRALREASERQARMRAEAALHENENRFRLLVDGLKDHALYMLDLNGCIASWNAAAERLYGYSQADALGLDISVFGPESERSAVLNAVVEAGSQGRSELECWRTRADGSTFWANVVTSPLINEAGTLIGYVQIVRDLSEQRAQVRKMTRMDGLYSLLSSLHAAILERPEAHALLQRACDIAVSDAGFSLAWVGLLRQSQLVPVAVAGGSAERLNAACGQLPRQHAVWQAMQQGRLQVRHALAAGADAIVEAMVQEHRLLRSALTLPLMVQGQPQGVLELYARTPDYFL